MKTIISAFFTFICLQANCQYSLKTFNWENAGFKGNKPQYSQLLNILNFGGDNTNTNPNNTALNNAMASLGNQGGIIYFPPGTYKFTSNVSINRDSIILKGAGYDSTQLVFNLNGAGSNCFSINGNIVQTDTTKFISPALRDSNNINVYNSSNFSTGDWVYLQCNDSSFMASTWAYGSLGQIMQIKSISGTTITFNSPFRFNYGLNLKPRIKKINPKKFVGFECLSIKREDATTSQTSNISFDYAVQCWINGIKSDSTNYAHVELNRSANIEIVNSYFHHAFAYGGGGQGYGIAFQYSSNECKAENNIFQNLRHSILLQAGANGNVMGYNYSFNPFWSQFPLPSSSAGDLVLHGNYPFSKLFEGNINQNTVIDNSHLKNGPYNTFFRNRSELFGIFMNSNPATDTTQFLANEVTNSTAGLYTLVGNGNLEYGNNVKGTLTPAGTTNVTDTSLYYSDFGRPQCFDPFLYNWPILGTPLPFNTNSNAAKDRAAFGKWAICECTNFNIGQYEIQNRNAQINVFPNPFSNRIQFDSDEKIKSINILGTDGIVVFSDTYNKGNEYELNFLPSGFYILRLTFENGKNEHRSIIKID